MDIQNVTTNNTEQALSQAQDSGTDNEVCQINDNKSQLEKSPDYASMSATQVCVLFVYKTSRKKFPTFIFYIKNFNIWMLKRILKRV